MKYFLVDNETGNVWDKSYLITTLEKGLDTVKRVNKGMGYNCFRLEVGENPTSTPKEVYNGKYRVLDTCTLTIVDSLKFKTLVEGKLVVDMLNQETGCCRYKLIRR